MSAAERPTVIYKRWDAVERRKSSTVHSERRQYGAAASIADTNVSDRERMDTLIVDVDLIGKVRVQMVAVEQHVERSIKSLVF